MIKKIYILLLTVLGMGVISSCSDYLNSEKYFKDRLTLEKTFESKDHVEEWLAYAFSFIKNENYEVTTKGPSENSFCFSDDMYYGDRDKTIDATKNELSYNMFKLENMMRILIMLGHGGHVIKEFSKHQYLSIMLTGVKRWLIGKY